MTQFSDEYRAADYDRIARERDDYKRMYEEMLDMKNERQERATALEQELNETKQTLGKVVIQNAAWRAETMHILVQARADGPIEVAHILYNVIERVRAAWYPGMAEEEANG